MFSFMFIHANNRNGHGKGKSHEGKDVNIIISVWFVCLTLIFKQDNTVTNAKVIALLFLSKRHDHECQTARIQLQEYIILFRFLAIYISLLEHKPA